MFYAAYLATDLHTYLPDGRRALIGGSGGALRRLRLGRTVGRADGPTNLDRLPKTLII